MTYEHLQRFAESLMTWLIQDPLAAGLVSAALVLVMLALALRWTLRKPVARDHAMTAATSTLSQATQPQPATTSSNPVMVAMQPLPAQADDLPARVELLADEVRALRRQLADSDALLRRQADKLALMERQHLLQPVAGAASEEAEDDVRQAGYEQAMMLAAHGVPVQELMAQCGLTRPEAQLIVLLHGRGGQA